MATYHEVLRERADEAAAELARRHKASADAQARRAAAREAAERDARPMHDTIEDSAAQSIAAQFGVPIGDVTVNGHRYADIVAARPR